MSKCKPFFNNLIFGVVTVFAGSVVIVRGWIYEKGGGGIVERLEARLFGFVAFAAGCMMIGLYFRSLKKYKQSLEIRDLAAERGKKR